MAEKPELATPERTLRYIRNTVQSYRAGGDAAAAVFAIGLIERILDEGCAPEPDETENVVLKRNTAGRWTIEKTNILKGDPSKLIGLLIQFIGGLNKETL